MKKEDARKEKKKMCAGRECVNVGRGDRMDRSPVSAHFQFGQPGFYRLQYLWVGFGFDALRFQARTVGAPRVCALGALGPLGGVGRVSCLALVAAVARGGADAKLVAGVAVRILILLGSAGC